MKFRRIVVVTLLLLGAASENAHTSGITLITHGFQPPAPIGNGALPGWVSEMGQAIRTRSPVAIPTYRVRFDKATGEVLLQDGAANIDLTTTGGAIIYLDWVGVANETIDYPAQNVADVFATFLFGQRHAGVYLMEVPIHLIGHSRGCSLNSRIAYALAGNGILVEHVTTLDPHPVRPGDSPTGNDWIPETFINTIFADNYYRTGAFPAGRAVNGAHNNDLSHTIDGDDCSEHESIHTYYHGTIRPTSLSDGNCLVQNIWYFQSAPRDETGYNFSRYFNPELTRPVDGLNQFVSGVVGTGARTPVEFPNQQLWPNVSFDQRRPIPSRVAVGENVSIPYLFSDRSSEQSITFALDADTNPYNGGRGEIGSVTQNSRPAGSIGSAEFLWTPTEGNVGTHFIRVMTRNTRTDVARIRYDYYLRPIVVERRDVPRPTISAVSPRTLNASQQAQTIVIRGTEFTRSSTLLFNSSIPSDAQRLRYISPTELQYDIVVIGAGEWTVNVVNGAVQSLPYKFYVVSGTAQLTTISVSGPAAINENSSAQFTATAYFGDGSQQNVTALAEWTEDSIATTISSSGLLSAGSVSGPSSATVRARYATGGITRDATANVTIIDSANCGTEIQDLIRNGTFVNDANDWTFTGSFYANDRFTICNSCPGYAWLANSDGTAGNNLSGAFSQSVTIPANATSATLGYYYRITSTDSTSVAKDFLNLNLMLPGGTFVGLDQRSNLHENSAYSWRSFDVTSYRGQTITVVFSASSDATGPTAFRVDDVSLIVSVPNPITPVLFGVGGPTSVAEGGTAQYNAIVVNCDGSIESVNASWRDNSGGANITASGILTAGNVTSDTAVIVTATYNSWTLDYPVTIVNSPIVFSHLVINGPTAIPENGATTYYASAVFSDGSSQPVTPAWGEDSTATTISSSGVFIAGEVAVDTPVQVYASITLDGVNRNATQDVLIVNMVRPVTLTSLDIEGPNSVDENTTVQLSAVAGFSDGTRQTVAASWSGDSNLTSTSGFGLVAATEVPSDTSTLIFASYTYGGVTLTAQKVVTISNVLRMYALAVSTNNGVVFNAPDHASYAEGTTVELRAVGIAGYRFDHWTGDLSGSQNPVTVSMDSNKRIVAMFSTMPTSTMTLVAWGDNSFGQTSFPTGIIDAFDITAGSHHNLALVAEGGCIAWGRNDLDQIKLPRGLEHVLSFAAGQLHTLGLTRDRTVMAWGYNQDGQLNIPEELKEVAEIAAYHNHSLALRSNGTVIAWGWNRYGQTSVPANLSNVVAISAGFFHSLALKGDGRVVGWGDNTWGQTTPPASATGVIAIASGAFHNLALRADGEVIGWGENSSGQCSVPVGLKNVKSLSAGYEHSLALTFDGTPVAWGANQFGQGSVPEGLSNVVRIVCGANHNIVVISTNPAGASFTASATSLDDTGLGLSVRTIRGRSYSLEFTDSLILPRWQRLLPVLGNNGVQRLTDSAVTTPQRFYRVNQQ